MRQLHERHKLIVQSHGYFDLLHPGHLNHLKLASELCWDKSVKIGRLVVSIPSGEFMKKWGHPLFTDGERVSMLKELRCVDEVVLICGDALKAIELVNPDIYVKGREYEGNLKEMQFCLDRGIQVRFLGEKIYGSTKIALKAALIA